MVLGRQADLMGGWPPVLPLLLSLVPHVVLCLHHGDFSPLPGLPSCMLTRFPFGLHPGGSGVQGSSLPSMP